MLKIQRILSAKNQILLLKMEQYCAIIKCVHSFISKKGKVYFMKVKQWLASSLAVLMLVSTVGCGDNSSSSKAESKATNSSAVVSETAMPEKDYATTTDGSAKVKIDGTKFMVGDKELWFNGVNAPWDKWNDFGGGFNLSRPFIYKILTSSVPFIIPHLCSN